MLNKTKAWDQIMAMDAFLKAHIEPPSVGTNKVLTVQVEMIVTPMAQKHTHALDAECWPNIVLWRLCSCIPICAVEFFG